jgi:hypothetical protein
MSNRLEELIAEARADRPSFEVSCSLGAALARKARRERRARFVQRSVIAVSSAAFFAFLLLRASAAPASISTTTSAEAHRQEIAARTLDDAGFARD